jgi:hypothetical protein
MTSLLLAGLVVTAGIFPDTSVTLRPGDRVVVEDLSGSVVVRAWERSTLSLGGRSDDTRGMSVTRSGERVAVGSADRKGRGRDVAVELRLPPWVALEIQGRELDVEVSGMTAEVRVRVIEGDIEGRDLGGVVTLSNVEGLIRVDGVRGRVSARSRGDDVFIRRAAGDVEVESGSGDLTLEDIDATSVRAQTLDGDLVFRGAMRRGGSYWFSVHDGDAEVTVPPGTGLSAKVATFDGEFTSDFPVTLQRYQGKGVFEFTLGDGGATLEIQVFDGQIRLLSGGR